MCSQWQPRWRDLCQAYFGPRCWTGKLSLAPSQAPPSSPGLQARVWKASHADLNAPSSACSDVRVRKEWRDRRLECINFTLINWKKVRWNLNVEIFNVTSVRIMSSQHNIMLLSQKTPTPATDRDITANETFLPWIIDYALYSQYLMVISPCCAQLCSFLQPNIQGHSNTLFTVKSTAVRKKKRVWLKVEWNVFVIQWISY